MDETQAQEAGRTAQMVQVAYMNGVACGKLEIAGTVAAEVFRNAVELSMGKPEAVRYLRALLGQMKDQLDAASSIVVPGILVRDM